MLILKEMQMVYEYKNTELSGLIWLMALLLFIVASRGTSVPCGLSLHRNNASNSMEPHVSRD